jgi:DNA-binding beta-propeller fold protein YncE
VGGGTGQYQVFDNTGGFKETIDTGLGGATTGGAFDAGTGRLYTTAYTASTVVAFDGAHPHAIALTIDTTLDGGRDAESIAIGPTGHVYVGHQGSPAVLEYDASGAFLTAHTVSFDGFGPDELDLAADGHTLFYTSNGHRVMRYDVLTGTQLSDFGQLPGPQFAGALRLLPPFDGSAGLIVSQSTDIRRLDATGVIVQNYGIPGEAGWLALDLDPNGTSFWAAAATTSNVYRFDIATGAVEVGPIHPGSGWGQVFGLIVIGGGTALPGRFCFGDGSGTPCPCGNQSVPGAQQGCASSLGVGGELLATGTASLGADSVALRGSHMPNSSALYLQGTAQVSSGAGVTFGDGLRCAGGSIIRLGAKMNVAGESRYPAPGDPPVSQRGLVTAPGDRFYQVWYRNAAAFCTAATFNLTNGARVTWTL